MKKLMVCSLGLALLLGACATEVAPPPPPPPAVTVAVDDQPYYLHGPVWVVGGVRRVWVAGHWGHRHGRRVWVHGFYVAR